MSGQTPGTKKSEMMCPKLFPCQRATLLNNVSGVSAKGEGSPWNTSIVRAGRTSNDHVQASPKIGAPVSRKKPKLRVESIYPGRQPAKKNNNKGSNYCESTTAGST
jgi:hypothetical protein